MNVRECKLCHRMIDFDEPWCDHETMEESAWLDAWERRAEQAKPFSPEQAAIIAIDPLVHQAAKELGLRAAKDFHKMLEKVFDAQSREWDAAQHRSDLAHVYQHRSQQ